MQNLNLPENVIDTLSRMNITTSTEIQKQVIPFAIDGFDILASSHTGSGKTLAYLLPIIQSFSTNKIAGILFNAPVYLVLLPTRELANQVRDALGKVFNQMKSAVLIGGEPMFKQMNQLKSKPSIIVGTPGRIIDHLQKGSLDLAGVTTLVLDEMDRMLDMGMEEQLEEINHFLPKKKQVLMFSATMPDHIITLSKKYSPNPKRIAVGSTTKPTALITQEILRISDKEKFSELLKRISEENGSIIIFVKTKRGADQLAKMLKFEGYKADAIHGDLSQSRRDRVMLWFRSSRIKILVATDVAARGLDVPHVQLVVNYDLPNAEDYLHRIGRTGRAGLSGSAISFVSAEDVAKLRAIERLINRGETTAPDRMMKGAGRKKSFNSRPAFKGNGDAEKRTGSYSSRKPADRYGASTGFSKPAGYRPAEKKSFDSRRRNNAS